MPMSDTGTWCLAKRRLPIKRGRAPPPSPQPAKLRFGSVASLCSRASTRQTPLIGAHALAIDAQDFFADAVAGAARERAGHGGCLRLAESVELFGHHALRLGL